MASGADDNLVIYSAAKFRVHTSFQQRNLCSSYCTSNIKVATGHCRFSEQQKKIESLEISLVTSPFHPSIYLAAGVGKAGNEAT